MSKRRRYHPGFAKDVRGAATYYRRISHRVENRFREVVKRQLEVITDHSDAFATVHQNVRAVRLRRFPYVVLYEAHSDFVLFVGLVHAASDREHWFDRSD